MQILVSTGTSDEPALAFMNALASLSGPMFDAEETRIIDKVIEHTPNGYVVTVRVMALDEEDLEKNPELREDEGSGGDQSVKPARREHDGINDIAYAYSAREVNRMREEIMGASLEEYAHPENYLHDTLPTDFEEAVQSDSSYVHHSDAQEILEQADRITTELSKQEIDHSVSYEMLSSEMVEWQARRTAGPAPGPEAPDPVLDENGVPLPEGTFEKRAKQPPPADSLDLVA